MPDLPFPSFARRFARGCLSCAMLLASSQALQAQPSYPSAPIHIVVPFAAGTSVDVVARIYGQKLGEILGGTVVVDNRPGAGSMLGTTYVARAKPDGYTLLAGSNSAFTIAPHVYPKIDYDPDRDFRLVSPLFTTSSVLMAGRDVPANSLAELIQLARSKPGSIAYGSYGIGTIPHLMMEMLNRKAGVEMIHVPYKGGVEVGQALLSGQLPVGFETVPTAAVRAKAGTAKPLAIFAQKRSLLMPDVPATAELGYSDVNIFGLVAVFAPVKTSDEVIRKLEGAHARIVQNPDFADRLRQIGAEPLDLSPQQLLGAMQNESRRVKEIAASARIGVQ